MQQQHSNAMHLLRSQCARIHRTPCKIGLPELHVLFRGGRCVVVVVVDVVVVVVVVLEMSDLPLVESHTSLVDALKRRHTTIHKWHHLSP
jgi:hypothetical protein